MMGFWYGRFADNADRFRDMPVRFGLMALCGLVFVATVVVVIVLLVKMGKRHSVAYRASMMNAAGNTAPKLAPDTLKALEILNERLAKGEVAEEEYERIKAKIRE
jgi:uncharacterized membrane protein